MTAPRMRLAMRYMLRTFHEMKRKNCERRYQRLFLERRRGTHCPAGASTIGQEVVCRFSAVGELDGVVVHVLTGERGAGQRRSQIVVKSLTSFQPSLQQ